MRSPKHGAEREAIRAWAARWRRVNAQERAELQATPVGLKLRQLAALMASVAPLGWTEALAAEVGEVRALGQVAEILWRLRPVPRLPGGVGLHAKTRVPTAFVLDGSMDCFSKLRRSLPGGKIKLRM